MAIPSYAVFGQPIGHSKSPWIHAQFAAQCGIALRYSAIEASSDQFPAALAAFAAAGGRGANVTLPLKELACGLCAELGAAARAAAAVNTMSLGPGGRWRGDNTDGVGLLADLARQGIALTGARVLLLGAGGAARGVLGPILAAGVARVLVANRNPERARQLAASWQDARLQGAGREAIAAAAPFDLVVNATAAGHDGEVQPLSPGWLAPAAAYYDLSYGSAAQPGLRHAIEAGAAMASDGLGMLVEQAAESFRIWHGVRPHTGDVLAALRKQLAWP